MTDPNIRFAKRINELKTKILMLSIENSIEPLTFRTAQVDACKRLLVKYENLQAVDLTDKPL